MARFLDLHSSWLAEVQCSRDERRQRNLLIISSAMNVRRSRVFSSRATFPFLPRDKRDGGTVPFRFVDIPSHPQAAGYKRNHPLPEKLYKHRGFKHALSLLDFARRRLLKVSSSGTDHFLYADWIDDDWSVCSDVSTSSAFGNEYIYATSMSLKTRPVVKEPSLSSWTILMLPHKRKGDTLWFRVFENGQNTDFTDLEGSEILSFLLSIVQKDKRICFYITQSTRQGNTLRIESGGIFPLIRHFLSQAKSSDFVEVEDPFDEVPVSGFDDGLKDDNCFWSCGNVFKSWDSQRPMMMEV